MLHRKLRIPGVVEHEAHEAFIRRLHLLSDLRCHFSKQGGAVAWRPLSNCVGEGRPSREAASPDTVRVVRCGGHESVAKAEQVRSRSGGL
ncbi:hypothetical protein ACFPRL_13205 [Pseudoclavibacter helvolus]